MKSSTTVSASSPARMARGVRLYSRPGNDAALPARRRGASPSALALLHHRIGCQNNCFSSGHEMAANQGQIFVVGWCPPSHPADHRGGS
jgi:hypothetical protein